MGNQSGEILITIIVIGLSAILLFVFPLIATSEMHDSESLAMVQSYTTEFVNQILSKGMITKEDYDAYLQKLYATGISFDVEFEIKIADSNPGKKEGALQAGDTESYSIFTKQVENELAKNGKLLLKQNDFLIVYAKSTSIRISQMFKSAFYGTSTDDYILAQDSGLCTTTGY